MAFTIKSNNINKVLKGLSLEKKGKVQIFLDNTVVNNLMEYVSLRTGAQEQSIKTSTVLGSGEVVIGVPYAEIQAYSSYIKKRDGKRGTRPFERMKADKKDTILKEVAKYSEGLK